jgi:hypothetical protein
MQTVNFQGARRHAVAPQRCGNRQMNALTPEPPSTVVAFPRRAETSPPRAATGARVVSLLRTAARDAQIAAPSDLDRLCAAGPIGGAERWALALVRTAARGSRTLVFHPDGAPMISASECWLASLVAASAVEDDGSVAFLAGRFLAPEDRRLAICFARRLAEALETRAAA